METKTKQKIKTTDITQHPAFTCALFLLLTTILGLISIACAGTPFFDWSILNMPFRIAKWIFPLCYFALFLILAEAVCIMWLSEVDHNETKIPNLIWHLVCITLLSLWPLFMIFLKLPIVAVCILGVATALMIYTTYRFMTTSVWAGSMYIIATLFTLTVLTYNFWIVFKVA